MIKYICIVFFCGLFSCTPTVKDNQNPQIKLLKISTQYCFVNGLCTDYVNSKIDASLYSIDSIIGMDFQTIDSFRVEKIKKLDLKKSSNQEVIEMFFKALDISNKVEEKHGETGCYIPANWFFEGLHTAENLIEGKIIRSEEVSSNVRLVNLSTLTSFELHMKSTKRLSEDEIEIFFTEYEDFSIVLNYEYFNIYKLIHFENDMHKKL